MFRQVVSDRRAILIYKSHLMTFAFTSLLPVVSMEVGKQQCGLGEVLSEFDRSI